MTIFNEKVKKEVLNRVLTLPKIDVISGKCRFNYKCQSNSVHEAIRKGDNYIAMVFYVDGDYPIIHFLNYRKGKYIDNTLGEWSRTHNYYFIKFIDKNSFYEVNRFFTEYRKELRKSLSFWNRIFSNIEF